jgi:type IV pilus assembly protein PilM
MTGNMKLFPVVGDYFALDIGTTAVRAVKLAGGTGGWSLEQYGYAPIDIKLSGSDAAEDQRRLGEVITTVVGQSGIRSRNVVLGVPSDKMFATVIDLPNVPESEIESVVKYQAEQYIPMSLDKAKVDWALLGKSVNDQTKNEVLLASVANTFSETRLDLIEGLGFNVIAIEPDSLALTRSLLPSGLPDARLIIEVGDFTTDIVIAYADAPRLIRSVPSGMQSLVKAATQNLNIEAAQATQFILKFGVQPDKLEGQVLRAVQTKYPSVTVGGMIMSNYGLMIPGLRELLSEKVKLPAELGNPWQRVRVGPSDQQKLQPLSSQFAVAIGLAERGAGA